MLLTVGRRYRFRAIHSLPDFPEPWCFPHAHDYTVDVEAEGGTPTDDLDLRWKVSAANIEEHSLDELFNPSTVENIAAGLLGEFAELGVVSVTVWEDEARFGRAMI